MYKFRCFILLIVSLFSFGVLANNETSYLVGTEHEDIITKILFDSVSKKNNIKFEYIEFDNFSEALEAVERGYVDFLSNVTYTQERTKDLDFSLPIGIEYIYIFTIGKADIDNISILAVPENTTIKSTIAEGFPDLEFIEYRNIDDAIAMLNSHQVDGVVDGMNQLEKMMLSGFDAYLFNDHVSLYPVSVVTPKGKNQDLLGLIEDHAHTPSFQKLSRESVDNYQLSVRKQALRKQVIQSGLDVREPIKIKLENMVLFANYQFDGSVDGIAAEILFQACNVLQLDCQLVSQADESWASMYTSLVDHSIDVLSPLAITDKRKELFFFSDGYYSPEAILAKRKNYKDGVYHSISEMFIEKIGVIEGNFLASLLNEMLPEKKFVYYKTQNDLLNGLLTNEVDYIAIIRATFNHKLRYSKNILPIVEDKDVGAFYSYELGFGFQKNEKGRILSDLFSKAINLINVETIIKKYDFPPDWYTTIQSQKKISRNTIVRFLFIISILVCVVFVFHRRSITDELTRLRNRLALYKKYGNQFPKRKVLVYLDINKFKQINDCYGHNVGDKVLKQLSTNIKRFWKGEAYRIGGDEFVLVASVDAQRAQKMLDNIRQFTFYNSITETELLVSVSMGMVNDLEKNLPLDDALNLADQSMYESKHRFRTTNRN
ncbi:GGDEF domain-containing protein [Vibrio diazotrophicus]|uniref:GGDEF domain-containing protein n=1 Tax=Vibrio diazotrophicus TaxID=685 RepID=UPI00142E5362|nr:GGDEF domain-containing protein [Vibrio diazotrophicus]NIY92613.1 transporter substrate-binding domain-containing protein [Vibrio diazotrophicus]